MSYEGYYELLCPRGHYEAYDCYADAPSECAYCGAPFAYRASVDQTNGCVPGCPETCPAKKRKLRSEDRWHTDHHGNRYATRLERWKPAPGSTWQKLN